MTLQELNVLPVSTAAIEFERCCGSSLWVQRMLARRPFRRQEELLNLAENIWNELSIEDWKEAFAHHPKIGDIENLRRKFSVTAAWTSQEQSGTNSASEETLKGLAEGNQRYEEQFGYIFIVCATGKSADEMLAILKGRLSNSPEEEIHIAAGEQAKITRLRIERLLDNSTQSIHT